jgi:aminomethyltransferase
VIDQGKLEKTPFFAHFQKLDAKIVDFAGWLMPVQFSGILKEHQVVRTGAGMFDVSHMGRLEIHGRSALEFVQYVTTNDASKVEAGQVQYTTICNEKGGILDDVTVYAYPEWYMLVVNASNTGKIRDWLTKHLREDVELRDATGDIAQLAVQGPESQRLLQERTSIDLEAIRFYQFLTGEVAGVEATVSRTGYTGEDGFEIYFPAQSADRVWTALLSPGEIQPCGLGARDLLRLEVNYCLYGNDIDETTTPLEAGLGWLVKLDSDDFIGKETLLHQKERGIERKLTAFHLLEKGIPRPGYAVLHDGERISSVSSGAFSPSLDRGIGTAYLPIGIAGVGTKIEVEIRDKKVPAETIQPPFYKEGSRR